MLFNGRERKLVEVRRRGKYRVILQEKNLIEAVKALRLERKCSFQKVIKTQTNLELKSEHLLPLCIKNKELIQPKNHKHTFTINMVEAAS